MNSNVSMLAYCKHILQSVYLFNKRLFKKEYRKSLRLLCKQEVIELRTWLRNNKSNSNTQSLTRKTK